MTERLKAMVGEVPIIAHGLLRRLAPLMLMVYRRRGRGGDRLRANGIRST
jgi:hypothetical protein